MVLIPISYYPEREKPPTYSSLYVGRIALNPGKNQVDKEDWDAIKNHPMILDRLDNHVIEDLSGAIIIQPSSKETQVVGNSVVSEPPPPPPPSSSKTTTKKDEPDKTGVNPTKP